MALNLACLMFCYPLLQIICVPSVVGVVSAAQDINPEAHTLFLRLPATSRRSPFDRLRANGKRFPSHQNIAEPFVLSLSKHESLSAASYLFTPLAPLWPFRSPFGPIRPSASSGRTEKPSLSQRLIRPVRAEPVEARTAPATCLTFHYLSVTFSLPSCLG